MSQKLVAEAIFIQAKRRMKKQWLVAFIVCACIGILTYGYLMTNHFLTYDSMWNLYSDQDMITSGRQFLMNACSISSYYDLPWLNGVLAIIYLSITSIFLVEIFDVKSYFSVALIGSLLVTFPSVISTFCYTYTVDGYMLAVLLITSAFWLTDKKKWGFIPGIVLLGISLGIYQAYLAFVMVLCILKLLLNIIEQQSWKTFFVKIGQYAAMGIGGYLLYVVSLNIMLAYKGEQLSGYQGTDKINGFELSKIPMGLKSAFMNFVDFARWENVLTTTDAMKFAAIFLLLLGACIYVYLYIVKECYRRPVSIVLISILVAAIPFCATIVNVLSPDTYQHLLMRGAWSLFFIFVIVLVDKITVGKSVFGQTVRKFIVIVIFIVSSVLVFEFSKMANIVGFNMQERYEKSYALSLRIVERLEETPGYEHGMKVAILGGEPDEQIYPSTDITTEDLSGYFGVDGDYFLNSTSKFATFMSHYLNVTITTIDYEEEVKITGTKEFNKMENFPSSESIRKIGDVWVVKLNG